MQTVDARGYRTACRVHGSGAPMVLIHGVGLRGEVWAPQVAAFCARRRVVVYDTLGHGRSDLPPEPTTLDAYVSQLEGLLDALDIARAAVVGHSMGAAIAAAFAIDRPARVSALAALCPVYARSAEGRAAALARAQTLARCGPAATIDATLARWFGDDTSAEGKGRKEILRGWLSSAHPVGYARAYAAFVSADEALAGRLGRLEAPALFLAAEHDPHSTPKMARRMAAEAPRGRVSVVPGARHMVPFVSPEAVNAPLGEFLEEHEA